MTIPDYQTLMLPVLQFYGDKVEHNKQETIDAIAPKMEMTDNESSL